METAGQGIGKRKEKYCSAFPSASSSPKTPDDTRAHQCSDIGNNTNKGVQQLASDVLPAWARRPPALGPRAPG